MSREGTPIRLQQVGFETLRLFKPVRRRQPFGTKELRVEQPRLVAGRRVAKHGDDGLSRPELAGEADRSCDVDAPVKSDVEALVMDEAESRDEALLILDEEGFIDGEALQVGGDPALPDAFGDRAALGFQLAAGVIAVERRAWDVGDGDGDVQPALTKGHGNAGKGAARADGADETVDFPVRLRPDFRPGRPDMHVAVRDIVELVGEDGALWMLAPQPFGHPRGDLHIIVVATVRR